MPTKLWYLTQIMVGLYLVIISFEGINYNTTTTSLLDTLLAPNLVDMPKRKVIKYEYFPGDCFFTIR
jgi:hypothetical protein